MTATACVARLEALGYTFRLEPGDTVRVILPGGIPAPPEAVALLERLRAHRGDLIEELRFRALSCGTPPRAAQMQMKLEPPAPALEEAAPEADRDTARRAGELRAALDALLADAEARAAVWTDAEAEAINSRYLALADELREVEACPS